MLLALLDITFISAQLWSRWKRQHTRCFPSSYALTGNRGPPPQNGEPGVSWSNRADAARCKWTSSKPYYLLSSQTIVAQPRHAARSRGSRESYVRSSITYSNEFICLLSWPRLVGCSHKFQLPTLFHSASSFSVCSFPCPVFFLLLFVGLSLATVCSVTRLVSLHRCCRMGSKPIALLVAHHISPDGAALSM